MSGLPQEKETCCGTGVHTMEERLAKVGARLDQLIVHAHKVKAEVETKVSTAQQKKEEVKKRSGAALEELKLSLDKAWLELNHAFEEVREGSERATSKLLAKGAKGEKHNMLPVTPTPKPASKKKCAGEES